MASGAGVGLVVASWVVAYGVRRTVVVSGGVATGEPGPGSRHDGASMAGLVG